MGLVISVVKLIVSAIDIKKRKAHEKKEVIYRAIMENEMKTMQTEMKNLSTVIWEQKARIIKNADMMNELRQTKNRTHDTINDIKSQIEKKNNVKIDLEFRNVQNSLDTILRDIQRSQIDIIQRIEALANEIIDEQRRVETSVLVSKLKTIFRSFANLINEFSSLPFAERIAQLEDEQDGILQRLDKYRVAETDSMYTLMRNLIQRDFIIPVNRDDDHSLEMLSLLLNGIDNYILMSAFMLLQYTVLCENYYEDRNIDAYNWCYIQSMNSYGDFAYTLVGVDGLVSKAIEVLDRVNKLDFIQTSRLDVVRTIAGNLTRLRPIASYFEENEKIFQVDIHRSLNSNLNFTTSKITTPICDWKSGSKVSYAIQFDGIGEQTTLPSMVSPWSTAYTLGELANPLVPVYIDPLGRTRIIWRRFDQKPPQIVAILQDRKQVQFRDIDRDLYNSAQEPNENIAKKNVAIYIENGANVNTAFEHKRSAIHVAAVNGHCSVLEELLNSGANVNARDDNGYTAIYIATEEGNEKFVQRLLNEKDIDVNTPSSDQNHKLTPLHCAVYKGHTEIVKMLMQFASIDVNAKTTDGFTPLHYAAYYNHKAIVSLFMADNRFDYNIKSDKIDLPLYLALDDTFDTNVESLVNSGNVSPLDVASAFSEKDLIESMLERGPEIWSKTNDGSSILHFLAFNKQTISSFDHFNMKEIVNIQNEREFTPIYFAHYSDNAEIAVKLKKYCSNQHIRLNGNKTLLHLAAINSHVTAAENLIRDNIPVSVVDNAGITPLHYAVFHGNVDVARVLLKHNADPNAIDNAGFAVVHYVNYLTEDKALVMIKELVGSSASVNVNAQGSDSTGRNSLLHYLCALEYRSVVEYLFDNSAHVDLNVNVNSLNLDKQTPFHTAAFMANEALIQILHNNGAKYTPDDDDDSNDKCSTQLCETIKGKGTLDTVEFIIQHFNATFGFKELNCTVANSKHEIFLKYFNQTVGDKAKDIFLTALQSGNLNVVKYYAENKLLINLDPVVAERNCTVLYYALQNKGDYDMVKYIIDTVPKWATLDVDHVLQNTLLHLAIEQNKYAVAELLLDKDVDFNSANSEGDTQLHLAAKQGMNIIVKRLIEKGAISSINLPNKHQYTAILYATEGYGNLEMINYLYQHNAILTLRTDKDETVLNIAAAQDKTDLARLFIEMDVNFVTMADKNGITPLHNAAATNNFKLVDHLIDKKVDMNAEVHGVFSHTPLSMAIDKSGDFNLVRELVNKKAKVRNCRICDILVSLAVQRRKFLTAIYLIDKGAVINSNNNLTTTALHAAIEVENTEMVQYLLDYGADYNHEYEGVSPMNYMIDKDRGNMINFFAYNYRDLQNKTLLHLMASQSNVKVMKPLLDRGAYVNAQDCDRNSPLHLAAMNGHLEAVEMLTNQTCSIDINIQNANKKTALDLAKLNKHEDVVNFLEHLPPHGRSRRQIDEQFSEPPVASSSASRASWWVSDFVGSVVGTLGNIANQASQSVLSSPYHKSAKPQSISSLSQSINVHGSLLLLDLLVRKFTGQTYVNTASQSDNLIEARINSLAIVQQFEVMLNRIANETNSHFVFELDSFELYRTVEHCLLNGQFSKIDRILLSTAREAFPNDSIQNSLLVTNIKELLIEALFDKAEPSSVETNSMN